MLLIDKFSAGRGGSPVARLESLSLPPGASALLIGRSGAGKTTLLLALAGLAASFGGVAMVDGQDVRALRGRALDRFRGHRIGLVFQDIHLVAGLSVLQNLLLVPFAAGAPQDPARARGLLERLGLDGHAGRMAETLSRGEAQRAAIARAMLLSPALILADEPTASLDDEACEQVIDLLLQAARDSGAALLVATHDARLRRRIAHQVQVEPAQ